MLAVMACTEGSTKHNFHFGRWTGMSQSKVLLVIGGCQRKSCFRDSTDSPLFSPQWVRRNRRNPWTSNFDKDPLAVSECRESQSSTATLVDPWVTKASYAFVALRFPGLGFRPGRSEADGCQRPRVFSFGEMAVFPCPSDPVKRAEKIDAATLRLDW